jgi:4'-phosphopantetheinyl transferase
MTLQAVEAPGRADLGSAPAPADAVDVWLVSLDQPDRVVAAAERCLTPAERRYAAAAAPHVRRRRILRRAALRRIAGRELGCDAGRVPVRRTVRGKPWIATGDDLEVSVTSSRDLALVAATRLGPVGVDVEHVASLDSWPAVAARAFPPAEADALLRLPVGLRCRAFYACWTQREACLKAVGRGLIGAPGDVQLELRSEHAASVTRLVGEDAARWRLLRLDLGSAAVAAVAVRAESAQARVRTLELGW